MAARPVNVKREPYDVYIGRGSKWGNRFVIGVHGTRDECIDQYVAEKSKDPAFIAQVEEELADRRLGCHCKPKRCHGDWLAAVANVRSTSSP